jgi:hypothetical protein
MSKDFEAEANCIGQTIPPGRRLVVVGSTSFWGEDSPQLCRLLAARLARIADLVAITGGMSGVGETFGRAFAAERQRLGLPERLYHLLPRGCIARDSGMTLTAGTNYEERREVLGRVGQVYLVVEGGPGTAHEVRVARARSAPVIAVARTGGHARDVYPSLERPPGADATDWELLQDRAAPLDAVVTAACALIDVSFPRPA